MKITEENTYYLYLNDVGVYCAYVEKNGIYSPVEEPNVVEKRKIKIMMKSELSTRGQYYQSAYDQANGLPHRFRAFSEMGDSYSLFSVRSGIETKGLWHFTCYINRYENKIQGGNFSYGSATKTSHVYPGSLPNIIPGKLFDFGKNSGTALILSTEFISDFEILATFLLKNGKKDSYVFISDDVYSQLSGKNPWSPSSDHLMMWKKILQFRDFCMDKHEQRARFHSSF